MIRDGFRQRVPRPAGTLPGGRPPWSGSAVRPSPTAEDVASILDRIDDVPRKVVETSAVLLPLFVRPAGLSLLFIRRASTLSRDAGHLAFPGGRRDGDESMLETALRESEEEIGLDRGAVTVLGALSQAFRVSDRASVAPFVGLVEGDPTLILNPAEVEAVIEVPLVALYTDGVSWEEIWERNDVSQAVQFFADDTHFGDDLLWGLSARILWDFLMRLWNAADTGSVHP